MSISAIRIDFKVGRAGVTGHHAAHGRIGGDFLKSAGHRVRDMILGVSGHDLEGVTLDPAGLVEFVNGQLTPRTISSPSAEAAPVMGARTPI